MPGAQNRRLLTGPSPHRDAIVKVPHQLTCLQLAGCWPLDPRNMRCSQCRLLAPCREVMVKVLESAMAAAAAPARGGFVREALTAQYPRLALLLESTFQRLVQDTDVRPGSFSLELHQLAWALPKADQHLTDCLSSICWISLISMPLLHRQQLAPSAMMRADRWAPSLTVGTFAGEGRAPCSRLGAAE